MKPKDLKPLAKVSLAFLLGATTLGLPSTVLADDDGKGLTLSAAYGGYKSRGGEFDDDNDLYEVSIGYRFLPFFGIDLGYTNLGDFGGDLASAEVDGLSASVVGIFPVTESFKIYGEVGQFYSDVDVRSDTFDYRETFEDETLFYGAGVSFRISDPLWVNVEYQRYKVEVNGDNWPLSDEDTDIDAVKVGVSLNF